MSQKTWNREENWCIGQVEWFGGYNKHTERSNNLGFLRSIEGNEFFFHRGELKNAQSVGKDDFVAYQERKDKKEKPCAVQVHVLDPMHEDTAHFVIDCLKNKSQHKKILSAKEYCCFISVVLKRKYKSELADVLLKERVPDSVSLGLFNASEDYTTFFEEIAKGKDFDALISRGVCPTLMTTAFIDQNIEQFSEWVRLVFEGKVSTDKPKDVILNSLITSISISTVLYLAFSDVTDGTAILTLRREEIDKVVRCAFTGEKSHVAPYVYGAYTRRFSSFKEYKEHTVIKPIINKYWVKWKMFNKKFSRADEESIPDDPEYLILGRLLALLNEKKALEYVMNAVSLVIWEGLFTGRISIDHPSLFKLFPQCSTLGRHYSGVPLSCEPFWWRREEIFLCRSKPCYDPQVKPDLSKHYLDFNIYDWLSHYGVNYAEENRPEKRDFAIKLAGYLNRVREIFDRLKCRSCGQLMMPNMDYARQEIDEYDEHTQTHITKPFQAAYRITVFRCANALCEQYEKDYYINHCIGLKCHKIIDSRDLENKCSKERYICSACGGCCKEHLEKDINPDEINQTEYEQAEYEQAQEEHLYRDFFYYIEQPIISWHQ